MSSVQKSIPAKTQDKPTDPGAVAELDVEALRNLAGFLDTLVEMDLKLKQRNEQKEGKTE